MSVAPSPPPPATIARRGSRRRPSARQQWLGGCLAGVGLLVSVGGAVVAYREVSPGRGTPWALVPLLAVACSFWGNLLLARARGYSAGLVIAVLAVGFFGGSCLPGFNTAKTVGFFWAFLAALQLVVLLALPVKRR